MNLLFKDVHGGFYIKIYFVREIYAILLSLF